MVMWPETDGGIELKRRRYSLQVDLIRRLRAIAKQWRSRGDCVVHLQEISSPLNKKERLLKPLLYIIGISLLGIAGNKFCNESCKEELYTNDKGHKCQVEERLVCNCPELQDRKSVV